MKRKKGLVIIHVDGLSNYHFQQAMEKGFMGFTKRFLEKEEYRVSSYRTGIPSVTPYAQAGILYGTNNEIPSFYWWDKKRGTYVRFGHFATFSEVAHAYFNNAVPLTQGGATISTCYPGGAKQTFALAFRRGKKDGETMRWFLFRNWVINPLYLIDWAYYSSLILLKSIIEYLRARLLGKRVAEAFVIGNLLNELFLHHLSRFATHLAMEQNFPVIYAAFYSYDEVAHAFGPDDSFSYRMLSELDNTIKYIVSRRNRKGKQKRAYEVVILSDHGQAPSIPFKDKVGKRLAETLATFLPTYRFTDNVGETKADPIRTDGNVHVSYSGGIAHLYFKDSSWRLSYKEIQKKFPDFIDRLLSLNEIGMLLVRDGKKDILLTKRKKFLLSSSLNAETVRFLSKFDDPYILAKQLRKLNTFNASGDIVMFGSWEKGKQINFELQAGGHGAFGGEQMHPFIALKREWDVAVHAVHDADRIHTLLKKLIGSLSVG